MMLQCICRAGAAAAVMAFLSWHFSVSAADVVLEGTVSSDAEGLLEGVLVSARKINGTHTVTVVCKSGGHWRFTGDRLSPGQYDLSTWAVGYSPAERRITIGTDNPGGLDLHLEPLEDKTGLAMQLSHTEWEMTLGNPSLRACGGCHLIGRIMTKAYTREEWEKVIQRMRGYGEGSAIRRHGASIVRQSYSDEPLSVADKELARYLSDIAGPRNLAALEFKTLPRPTGIATDMILTSYELAREDSAPHDVAVDSEGIVWHSEITLPYLGRLDPATGETALYRVPENKQGFPPGTFDIEFDKDGNPWFGLLWQGGIGKLDKGTGKVSLWQVPPEWNKNRTVTAMVAVGGPGGKVWFSDNAQENFHRLDPRTGRIETFPHPDDSRSTYGVTADSHGNAWFAGLYGNSFGKVDAGSGKITYYTPPTPDSGPRRIQADSHDRIWFAEFRANKVAMFDPVTEQFREWLMPSPYSGSYDVAPSETGEVIWISGNYDDRIYRLDTRTDRIVTYAWPRPFPNVQRLSVDPSRDTARSVWVAEDNYGRATLLEIPAPE